MSAPTRLDASALDEADPLAPFVERFVRDDPSLVYLDGNSLGRLPIATRDRLRDAIEREWGRDLVRGWDRWIDLPRQVGDRIAPIIGAREGEVVVCDSTTVNLYKLAGAALTAGWDRRITVVPHGEFPTDRYVLQGIVAARGGEVREGSALDADEHTALVVASAVDYRTGAVADMKTLTSAAHAAGALVCWDLSHAAGSVQVDLDEAGVDLAVGCTYKYLCAGPGAPAFLYVRSDLQPTLGNPIWGWFAQRDQFAMSETHDPNPDIRHFLTGTPNVLGCIAVEEGAKLVAAAGIGAIRAKGVALCALGVELADEWLAPLGFSLVSPRDPSERGSHLALSHPEARRIARALRERHVVIDVRPPDILRVAAAPLSTRFVELWDGFDRLRRIVSAGEHLRFSDAPGRVS